MKNRNLLLSTAVSVALASFATNSSAYTFDLSQTSTKPAVFAAELPASTASLTIPSGTIKFPTPSTDIVAASPFYIKFNLLNATKFTASPTVNCDIYPDGGVANTRAMNLQLGAGTNALVFTLPLNSNTKLTLKSTGFCTMAFGAIEMPAITAVSMSALVEYKPASQPLTKDYKAQLISFANTLTPTYSASLAQTIIDVSQASLLFTTAGSLGKKATNLGTKTAYLGTVLFGNKGGNTTSGLIDGGTRNLTAKDALDAVELVISGPLLSSFNSTGRIFLNRTADILATDVCRNSSVAASKRASGSSVSFKLTNAADIGYIQTGQVHVCFVTNGKVPMEKGQITVAIKPTAKAGYRVATPATTNNNLVSVTKNGSSKKALNVPSPTMSDIANIRINNMTSGTGKVFITAYQEDGTIIGGKVGVPLADPLTPYQATVLRAPQIATLLGVTGWTGRAWLQIESEVADIAVQNLVRSPGANGNLTNLSDSVAPQGQ